MAPKGLRRLLASKRRCTKKKHTKAKAGKQSGPRAKKRHVASLKPKQAGRTKKQLICTKKKSKALRPPAALRVGSKRWLKRMAELGLVQPAPKQNLKQLQAKWYAKLAAEGFDDIEWSDPSTGRGQDSRYLKRSRIDLDRYEAMELFSRMAGIYANHATFDLKWDREIWERFANGIQYRVILKQLRALGMRKSLYWIWARINVHLELLKPWHSTHPEGLYSPEAYEEPYVVDVLLTEPAQRPTKLSMQ